jgi:hypothetical protein
MERVLIDALDNQCAVRLRWKRPPSLDDDVDISTYSIYIRGRDTSPKRI